MMRFCLAWPWVVGSVGIVLSSPMIVGSASGVQTPPVLVASQRYTPRWRNTPHVRDIIARCVTSDGRFVAYDKLRLRRFGRERVPVSEVFVRDMRTGRRFCVSVDSSGRRANGQSFVAGISDDGGSVLFRSFTDNLVDGDHNYASDVFIYDRIGRETRRVSVGSGGVEGIPYDYPLDEHVPECAMSSDGKVVAFSSRFTNLLPGADQWTVKVFVADLSAGTLELVSQAPGGGDANESSVSPAISPNGRFVSFVSAATNLVGGDTNAKEDVFLFDRVTRVMRRASVSSEGEEADGVSWHPSVSDAGMTAFESYATNLVLGDINGKTDIFLHDPSTGSTTRVSSGVNDTEADQDSSVPSISGDGSRVVFVSGASNLTPGIPNQSLNIFCVDIGTSNVRLLSADENGAPGNYISVLSPTALSANGAWCVFSSGSTNLSKRDRNYGILDAFIVHIE